ncbi:MAG: hypothetical protein PHS41_12630 [Victivallaceae bacterium]|nr:hypothetical protein [Victivallaceae bacterium]
MTRFFLPFLLALVLPGAAFCAEIFSVRFDNPSAIASRIGLAVDRKQAEASVALLDGAAACTIKKPGNSLLSVEFYTHGRVKIVQGAKYVLKFRAKSSRKATINAACYLNVPNWKTLNRAASAYFTFEEGKWTDCSMTFVSDISADNVRIPSFRLGKMPAGTVFSLQSVTMEGPDKVDLPAMEFAGGRNIQNFPAKICWDLTEAWNRRTEERIRFSMNAFWEIRPVGGKALTEPCYLRIPGSWRGANSSGFVRNMQGRPVASWYGKPIGEYENVEIRRTFDAPGEWRGRSVRLKCDYAHAETEVILNGKTLGKFGEAQDFVMDCDLGDALRFDGGNELILRMHSTAKRGKLRGGILDPLYLDVRPLKNFGMPTVLTEIARGKMKLRFHKCTEPLAGNLQLTLTDVATGEKVFDRSVPYQKALEFDYVAPKLWDTDHPNLYDLGLKLSDAGGKLLDTEKIRIGFRELTIRGKDYCLNGKPIRLLCDSTTAQPDWIPSYFTSPDTFRNKLLALKKMRHNCCYVDRAEQSVIYDVADEVGMLLISKIYIIPYLKFP